MVGFPGEDKGAFMNTHDLLMELPVTYLHVFAFSRRYATEAAVMEEQVDPDEKKARSTILREVGRRKSLEFRNSLVGKTLDVLILTSRSGSYVTGLGGNYVKVLVERPVPVNTIVQCRITGVEDGGVLGDIACRV
jgi:threonylcarbamoyladenosine tRNA methylthiotransferase MtaB